MNLKLLKNALTSKVGRQTLILKKHSPVILFVAGSVGMVATVVLASRATLKLDAVLSEIESENLRITEAIDSVDGYTEDNTHIVVGYTEDDAKRDRITVYVTGALKIGKLYALPAVVGLVSLGALTGAHVVLTKRNLAVTAAYAALERGYHEYRKRVVAELGSEKDRQFQYGDSTEKVVETKADGTKVTKTVTVADGLSVYARFFDETCESWQRTPSYNQLFLQCQQNYANDLLRSRGHVFLNEVYDMLGFERTKAGQVVGWVLNGEGDGFIDFGVFSGDTYMGQKFVNGEEKSVRLDFNVDGVVYDKI